MKHYLLKSAGLPPTLSEGKRALSTFNSNVIMNKVVLLVAVCQYPPALRQLGC